MADAISLEKVLIAEESYVRRGVSRRRIAAEMGLARRTVESWAKKYEWERKRKAWMSTPRTVGLTLREMLQEQMEGVVKDGKLDVAKVEEVERLTRIIDRVEKEGYQFLAAAVEVMQEFARWLRAHGPGGVQHGERLDAGVYAEAD